VIHVKFYKIPTGSCSDYDAVFAMNHEYEILKSIHEKHIENGGFKVIQPLGINKRFYAAIATEFAGETSLSNMMEAVAKKEADGSLLSMSLEKTAKGLKKIHDTGRKQFDVKYEVSRLEEDTVLGIKDEKLKKSIVDAIHTWKDNEKIASLGASTIHGDANPTNFIVNENTVYALDFERLEENRSPLVDLGFMIADLKHHFKFYESNDEETNKYVNCFLKAYNGSDPKDLLELARPYIGCGLIRITKFINAEESHRLWLIDEAFKQLKK